MLVTVFERKKEKEILYSDTQSHTHDRSPHFQNFKIEWIVLWKSLVHGSKLVPVGCGQWKLVGGIIVP